MSKSILNPVVVISLTMVSMSSSYAFERNNRYDPQQQIVSCTMMDSNDEVTTRRDRPNMNLSSLDGDGVKTGCLPDDTTCENKPLPEMLTLEQCQLQSGVATILY